MLEESTTYQAILRKGEARGKVDGKIMGARELLLKHATKLFGPPDASTLAKIEAVGSVDELTDLVGRCSIVSNWKELLS